MRNRQSSRQADAAETTRFVGAIASIRVTSDQKEYLSAINQSEKSYDPTMIVGGPQKSGS